MADFIVAIELGSSKITGIAGKEDLDGNIKVMAVATENSSSCIRKGVIYNIDKTVQTLTNIIKKLENTLKTKIAYVYVGTCGQSIHGVNNMHGMDLPEDVSVTQKMVDDLMDINRTMRYQEQEVMDAVAQEYKADNLYCIDPVGIQCKRLEGNFLNILWRKSFDRNIHKCFDSAGIAIEEIYLTPLVLAESVLTDIERRGGCLLVDIGADITTMCVYYKDILRFICVIPLGSNNITKDIMSLQMEEENAERMKLEYGNAFTEPNDVDPTKSYLIDNDREVPMHTFVDIVEGRLNEIIENVWYQVPQEYTDKLLGGIILTGGGSKMKNIKRAFKEHTHINKIRIANTINSPVTSNNPAINAKDGTMCAILALLSKGKNNCAGEEYGASDTSKYTSQENAGMGNQPPRANEGSAKMTIKSEAERAAEEKKRKEREEEERLRKEEEERLRIEEEERLRIEEEEERERERIRRENSIVHKTFKSFKNFFKKMIDEDEEK